MTFALFLSVREPTSNLRVLLYASALSLLGWTPQSIADESGTFVETQNVGPRQLVKQATEELTNNIMLRRDALRNDPALVYEVMGGIVTRYVDLERTSTRVLGRYWRDATPDQKERFRVEFRVMLVRTLCAGVSDLTSILVNHVSSDDVGTQSVADAVSYHRALTNVADTQATVQTEVKLASRQPIAIKYQMHRADGPWKIFDVTFGDVSLVSTYRLSFGPVVRKHGMDVLIEQLADKNRQRAQI